jgi:hypothetical protein
MPDKQSDLIKHLAERVHFLQGQLDQSVLIEAALVTALKELVPGFCPRFDQLHRTAGIAIAQNDTQAIATFLAEQKKKHQQ